MSKQGPSGEVPDVNVSGQGIQIGTGNNMYNAWMPKPPLDPAALGALNPHAAVARLQQLSRDELVDFFARASPDDVGEILEVFLEADEAKIVASLGDINRRKATELITVVRPRENDELHDLPEAAQEIARKAAGLRWTDAGRLEYFIGNYVRKYTNGHVHWSRESGVRTTTGIIDDYWANDVGWEIAIGDQESAASSPFGTDGIQQIFTFSTVYGSKHGTFRVTETKCYEDAGGTGDWLGFPIGEAIRAKAGTDDFARIQRFEGGVITSYYNPENSEEGTFAVRSEIARALPDHGWWAIAREAATTSSFGTSGTVQHFEVAREPDTTYHTAVYWHEPGKTGMIAPEIWDYYSKLGAERSWLGFPVTHGISLPKSMLRQRFEGGTVYRRSKVGPIAVRKAVDDFIFQDRDLLKRLGFPVSEEQPIGTDGSDRIQFFDGGVVTCRDGKYQVWLRPDAKPQSSAETTLSPKS